MKRREIEVFYDRKDHMGYEFARRVLLSVGDIKTTPGDIRIEVAGRTRGPKLKEQMSDAHFTMAEWYQITQRIKLEIDGLVEKTLDMNHNKEVKNA